MGCDIHSVAQVLKDGQFVTVATEIDGDHRSYNTFAILADVRNGHGFAGIRTGSGFIPIAERRGLPEDFATVDDYEHPVDFTWFYAYDTAKEDPQTTRWMGDHSHSWLTLAEIDKYITEVAEQRKTTQCGVVAIEEYRAAKRESRNFRSWYGDISGQGVVKITEATAANYDGPTRNVFVCAEWANRYVDCSNIVGIQTALRKIQTEHSVTADHVRFVFGFDS